MSHGFIILTLKKNDWACNTGTLHLLARKNQNNAVCRQDSFDCFLELTKSLHDRNFGSWEYCQCSSVHWNNKKPTAEGVSSYGVNNADFVAAWQCKTAHCSRNNWSSGDAKFEVLSHPPYSPDLAPSDFHFFPHLKRDLKGTHFTSDNEVKQAVTSWIKQRTPEFFIDGMRKLVLRWEKCIERQGDYVEKKVCQFVAKILYCTSYFLLFKYMAYFSRYFTVCITYQPPLLCWLEKDGPEKLRLLL